MKFVQYIKIKKTRILKIAEQKYIRNWSLKEDIKVCLRTLKTIICGNNY